MTDADCVTDAAPCRLGRHRRTTVTGPAEAGPASRSSASRLPPPPPATAPSRRARQTPPQQRPERHLRALRRQTPSLRKDRGGGHAWDPPPAPLGPGPPSGGPAEPHPEDPSARTRGSRSAAPASDSAASPQLLRNGARTPTRAARRKPEGPLEARLPSAVPAGGRGVAGGGAGRGGLGRVEAGVSGPGLSRGSVLRPPGTAGQRAAGVGVGPGEGPLRALGPGTLGVATAFGKAGEGGPQGREARDWRAPKRPVPRGWI